MLKYSCAPSEASSASHPLSIHPKAWLSSSPTLNTRMSQRNQAAGLSGGGCVCVCVSAKERLWMDGWMEGGGGIRLLSIPVVVVYGMECWGGSLAIITWQSCYHQHTVVKPHATTHSDAVQLCCFWERNQRAVGPSSEEHLSLAEEKTCLTMLLRASSRT